MFVARFPATIGVLDRSLVISNINPREELVDAYPSQAFRWHIGGAGCRSRREATRPPAQAIDNDSYRRLQHSAGLRWTPEARRRA